MKEIQPVLQSGRRGITLAPQLGREKNKSGSIPVRRKYSADN
jgi:hypothetical protein